MTSKMLFILMVVIGLQSTLHYGTSHSVAKDYEAFKVTDTFIVDSQSQTILASTVNSLPSPQSAFTVKKTLGPSMGSILACSNDGRIVIIPTQTELTISYDYGRSFATVITDVLFAGTMSPSGQIIYVFGGSRVDSKVTEYYYISKDYGVTWTKKLINLPGLSLVFIASMSGSDVLFSALSLDDQNAIYTYLGNETKWELYLKQDKFGLQLGSSFIAPDYIFVLTSLGQLLINKQKALFNNPLATAMACSATGQYIFIGGTPDYKLFRSSDYGTSFTEITGHTFFCTNRALTVSASGQYVATLDITGKLLYSTDFGLTFTAISSPLFALQMTPLGNMIYIFNDIGNLLQALTTPQMLISDIATEQKANIGSETMPFENGYFANKVYANGIALTSSRDKKQNIQTMPDMTDFIMKLRPVTFQYKGETNTHHGFIVDEVDPTGNSLVAGEHLQITELIGMLVDVVQRQQKTIQSLTH